MREQEAGDAGWKQLVEVESQRWRRLLECPQFVRYASGEVLAVIMDRDPYLGSTGNLRHPGHKHR